MKAFSVRLLGIFTALVSTSCGYHLQGQTNPFQDIGIRRIYVKQFGNDSFRPGLEHLFTAAMVRELEKSHVFQIVNSEKSADAILTGIVTNVNSGASSTSSVVVRGSGHDVAAQYSGGITCSISLVETGGRQIYSHSESQSKLYLGSVLTGKAGATVPLMNESEQRMAYQYMATQMMSNTYQNMVDLF